MLSAVSGLLEKYGIDPNSVGRLEVKECCSATKRSIH
jgi:hypothetical protein